MYVPHSLYYSFQRNGNNTTASKITIRSRAIRSKTVVSGIVSKGAKAAFDNRIKRSNCGMIIGNPKTAIIAAFCCALAAMAARNVNTRLRLQPPKRTSKTKEPGF